MLGFKLIHASQMGYWSIYNKQNYVGRNQWSQTKPNSFIAKYHI